MAQLARPGAQQAGPCCGPGKDLGVVVSVLRQRARLLAGTPKPITGGPTSPIVPGAALVTTGISGPGRMRAVKFGVLLLACPDPSQPSRPRDSDGLALGPLSAPGP